MAMKLSPDAQRRTADGRATVLALILLIGGCSPASGAAPSSAPSPTPPTTVDVAAPDERGVIELRVGPSGEVLGYRVVSMSGGTADQWERVARSVAATLRERLPTMTGDSTKGAIVTVNVSASRSIDGTRHVRTHFTMVPAPQ
jgi:hypothetical protein